jgi:hypothetical protein
MRAKTRRTQGAAAVWHRHLRQPMLGKGLIGNHNAALAHLLGAGCYKQTREVRTSRRPHTAQNSNGTGGALERLHGTAGCVFAPATFTWQVCRLVFSGSL